MDVVQGKRCTGTRWQWRARHETVLLKVVISERQVLREAGGERGM